MANNVKYAVALKNTRMNVITTDLDASSPPAVLNIYTGTQPANPDTALSSNTLLVTLTLTNPIAPGASGGVLTFSSITSGTAGNTGTATWGSLMDGAGTRWIDFTVGTSGADLNLNVVAITSGQTVACSSFTITSGD